MFKKKKTLSICGDSWAVYTYTYGEGQRAVISFDVVLGKEDTHQGYQTCKRVIAFIPASEVSPNGMPGSKGISDALNKFEDDVVGNLEKQGVDCKLTGRMTYGGMRDFVFQVEDTAAFDQVVEKAIAKNKTFKFEIKESPGWQFFDEKVKPKPVYWMQIEDMKVIENLLRAGSNPNVLHMIEYVITGDKAKLQKVCNDMVKNGFKEISLDDSALVIGKESRLNIDEIFSVTSRFFGYCPANGVEYDGWGTKVIK
jgi:regulator of RNase E activity RraB